MKTIRKKREVIWDSRWYWIGGSCLHISLHVLLRWKYTKRCLSLQLWRRKLYVWNAVEISHVQPTRKQRDIWWMILQSPKCNISYSETVPSKYTYTLLVSRHLTPGYQSIILTTMSHISGQTGNESCTIVRVLFFFTLWELNKLIRMKEFDMAFPYITQN